MKYKRDAIIINMNTNLKTIAAAGFAAVALMVPACSSHAAGEHVVQTSAPVASAPAVNDGGSATVTAAAPSTTRAPEMIRLDVNAVAAMDDEDAVVAVAKAAKSWYLSLGLEMPRVKLVPVDSTQLACPTDTSPKNDDAITCKDSSTVQWSRPYVAKARGVNDDVHRVFSVMAMTGHEFGHVALLNNGKDFYSESAAQCLAGGFARAQGVPAGAAGRGAGTILGVVHGGDYDKELNDFADGYTAAPSAVWDTCAGVK